MTTARTSPAGSGARWLLGLGLAAAGTTHLTVARDEFRAQVPGWMPNDADLVVVGSGVVEIALGLNSDRARLVPLFFQPLLVAWALWATGAWRSRRRFRD